MKRLIIIVTAIAMAIPTLEAQETVVLKAGAGLAVTNEPVTSPQRSIEEDSSGLTVTYTFSTASRQEDPLYPNHYM